MDLRRITSLVLQLPRGARLWRAVFGEAAEWTTTDELLATVAELVDLGNWYFYQAFRKRDRYGNATGPDRPPPFRAPRPRPRTSSPAPAPPARAGAPPADDAAADEPAGVLSMSDPRVRQFFAGVVRYTRAEADAED